jgi:uncharacterized protein YecE (DUF72 family)
MKEIKVGCCGFPVGKKKYYETFDIVEVNSTFYQLPTKETAKGWLCGAPQTFIFSIKAWQLITHLSTSPTYRKVKGKIDSPEMYGFFKNNRYVFNAWERTLEIAEILKAKVIVFQCPPNFVAEEGNIKNVKTFFKKISKDVKDIHLGIEFRNISWTDNIVKSLCEECNVIHIVDPLHSKPFFRQEIRYYRLHGSYDNKGKINYRYKYSDEDLKKVISLCDGKINYVLLNNVYMYDDALRLKEYISKKGL